MDLATHLFIFFLVGAFAAWVISVVFINTSTKNLNKKFVELGDMKGKKITEFYFSVGPPRSAQIQQDGSKVLTWKAGRYSIIILFDKNGDFNSILNQQF